MGIKLLANADTVYQVYYPASSLVEVDISRIDLRMSDSPNQRNLSMDPVLNHMTPTLQNGPLMIPAGQVRTFHSRYTLPIGITTTGISPACAPYLHQHEVLCRETLG